MQKVLKMMSRKFSKSFKVLAMKTILNHQRSMFTRKQLISVNDGEFKKTAEEVRPFAIDI